MRLKTRLYPFIIAILMSFSIVVNADNEIKSGFVYLDQVSSSIRVDIRYASDNNLLGKPLAGIGQNRAVLTREAAAALAEVQEELLLRGYSLVVYNAYIPQQAVKQIEEAISMGISDEMKNLYFPNLSADDLASQGYLREKRDNIRGSSVDVSIIPVSKDMKKRYFARKRSYSESRHMRFLDDGTSDMGTSYDTFDSLSCHACAEVTLDVQSNRALLKELMENYGFKASNLVWWKYTYIREPFPDSSFDFNI